MLVLNLLEGFGGPTTPQENTDKDNRTTTPEDSTHGW